MSKEKLRMQMLAGVITEGQYRSKLKKFTILENNFKKSVNKLLLNENEIPAEIDEFFDGMINMSIPEDAEEGEKIVDVWEREDYDEEFIKAFNYLKSKGGTVTIPGNPDVTYTALPGGNIRYSLVVTVE